MASDRWSTTEVKLAGNAKLGGNGLYPQGQGCHPEGSEQAGQIGQRDPHEIGKGQMQSPVSGKEAALAMTQTGEQFSRKGPGGLGRQQAGLEPWGQ